MDKGLEIIKKINELCNSGRKVVFERDFGDNTLTIYVDDHHTHVGWPEGSFENLIDDLHNALYGGPGLSWANENEQQ